ncbi:DUF2711 family protein [Bacillus sp. SG-1]|uniref:DUF2711 family protein n=1 Tax=Bacillus sp. SG-1 TaxID=161544 RepID=UPI0001543245|nr:DUF2711 family protein [Bacillus sp. SG-1]EDL66669.1 hypothetical protein BSG1_04915 [Bacillus sp. SG-1]
MNFFYPLKGDLEKDPVLIQLPKDYYFSAKIFYPFIKMPVDWKSERSAYPHIFYPVKEDILKFASPVSWAYVKEKCGFNSISDVSKAVTAGITGGIGRKIYRRPDLLIRLNEVIDENTYYPREDEFPVIIMKNIFKVLGSKGATSIQYVNLYDERGTYKINEIDRNILLQLCSGPITITDENEDFVFTCYFDEVSALFFAKEDVREILVQSGLEGVILGDDTPLVWENHHFELLE